MTDSFCGLGDLYDFNLLHSLSEGHSMLYVTLNSLSSFMGGQITGSSLLC